MASVHHVEKIVACSGLGGFKDHIQNLRLELYIIADYNEFMSAWRSLTRHLHCVMSLHVFGYSSIGPLKSSLIGLRPCPRPLLHLKTLSLHYLTFLSFSVLFHTVTALPSLQELTLNGVSWTGACNPDSPPLSTAISRIIHMEILLCTEPWPVIWIFTASLLSYRRPWHAPEIAEES